MHATDAANDLSVLTGSPWIATPHDYNSTRYLVFESDGRGRAIYGYVHTIYADVRFTYELVAGQKLRLSYLSHPNADNAEKLIAYNLARGEYRGIESIVAWPFVCEWLLTLDDAPWPAGMTFPHSVPTRFFGYIHYKPRRGTLLARIRWFLRRMRSRWCPSEEERKLREELEKSLEKMLRR